MCQFISPSAGYELSLLHILVYTRCLLLKVFAILMSIICHCDIILITVLVISMFFLLIFWFINHLVYWPFGFPVSWSCSVFSFTYIFCLFYWFIGIFLYSGYKFFVHSSKEISATGKASIIVTIGLPTSLLISLCPCWKQARLMSLASLISVYKWCAYFSDYNLWEGKETSSDVA